MTDLPTEAGPQIYKRHRFPAEIISHAMWLYFRFPLSLRHVEDLLAERGIEVSFQTVAEWAGKFGGEYARRIRRRSKGRFADKWHLDEMVVTMDGVGGRPGEFLRRGAGDQAVRPEGLAARNQCGDSGDTRKPGKEMVGAHRLPSPPDRDLLLFPADAGDEDGAVDMVVNHHHVALHAIIYDAVLAAGDDK